MPQEEEYSILIKGNNFMTDRKQKELLSDSELIPLILSGDASLFEIIIRRYNPYLFKIGRSYGYKQEDTEDLIQETFISAYTSLKNFKGHSSFKTWVVRIMLNHCYHKREKFSFKYEFPSDSIEKKKTTPVFTLRNNGPARIVMNNELKNIIENAILRLSKEYRLVFTLRELNGMSTRETAEALNISESNVKVRLKRAKSMLQQEIRKIYSPEEIFEFNLIYCNRIVENVLKEIECPSTVEDPKSTLDRFKDWLLRLKGKKLRRA